jgi:translocation protein SEC72
VYAFATVDGLFVLLWLTAWAAVASYVSQGKSDGEKLPDNKKAKKTGCDAFAYGSASKCSVSEATVIFGVIILWDFPLWYFLPAIWMYKLTVTSLLFVATSYFSFRNVFHFRQTGTMPDVVADPTFDAQTNAAFSSNPAHDFEEEDEFRSGRTADRPGGYGAGADHEQDYALLQQSELEDMQHHAAVQGSYDPTAPAPGQVMHDYDTSYGGAYGQHYNEPSQASQPYEPYPQNQGQNYGYQSQHWFFCVWIL